MRKLSLAIVIILVMTYKVYSKIGQSGSVDFNLVPDQSTAIKIAEAIWLPIYGEKIYKEKPFIATLKDSTIWVVRGTLNSNSKGGTAYIEIQKKDCKILKVTHYR